MPRFITRLIWPVLLAVFSLLVACAPAQAAFPGTNGKIAFSSISPPGPVGSNEIYTMNPDGTALTNITNNPADNEVDPSWSSDGTKIAFGRAPVSGSGNAQIYTMNADGSGVRRVTSDAFYDSNPTWSPDGTKIAFGNNDIYTINADGTGQTRITNDPASDGQPAWSPDGAKIVFVSNRSGNGDIYAMNADGSAQTRLTNDSEFDLYPSWSPDGTKIVFSIYDTTNSVSALYVMNADGTGQTQLTPSLVEVIQDIPAWSPDGTKIAFNSQNDIYTVKADGTARTNLTSSDAPDFAPDWQPLQTYPRPKGATPLRVALVPAYTACTATNSTHGAPLAYGSCNPPAQASGHLTVGTPDANGQADQSVGSVRLDAIVGNPSTSADEADARIATSITDVRRKAGLADYNGELSTVLHVRLTDRLSGVGQTVQDFPFNVTVPCTVTADPTIGSNCSLTTTADTVTPGAVPESKRSIWALDKIEVYDGGPDGLASTTAGNTLFETQGVFVP